MGHSAAIETLNALGSGRAFQVDFFLLPVRVPAEARARMAKALETTLNGLRTRFDEETVFELADGLDFELAEGLSEPVVYPMRDERAEHPSMFRLPPGSKRQVYLIISAADRAGVTQHLHFLLWPAGEKWRARNVWAKPASVDHLSLDDILAAAAEEEGKGDLLLAFALYTRAAQTAKGPDYRTTGMQHRTQPLLQVFQTRHAAATPPAVIDTAEGRIAIEKVGAVEFAQGPHLLLDYGVPAMAGEEEMEAQQKMLAAACLKQHPRIEEYFAGIAVQAMSSALGEGGRGYRSAHSITDLRAKP